MGHMHTVIIEIWVIISMGVNISVAFCSLSRLQKVYRHHHTSIVIEDFYKQQKGVSQFFSAQTKRGQRHCYMLKYILIIN